MKILVELKPFINGVRVNGRQAWIAKDSNGKLLIDNIYATKDSADNLNESDLLELLELQDKGAIEILDVYKR